MAFKSINTKQILLIGLLILITGVTRLFGQAANLDQTRNGPIGVTVTTPTADWVNGNAGPQNSHYAEGWSIPYRMIVTGLTNGTHTLIIEWDTKQSGGHAIDFVTRYDFLDNPPGSHVATFGHTPEVINPLLGLSGSFSSPSTQAFPAPTATGSSRPNEPYNSFHAIDVAGNAYMTIYNGTIAATGMTYDFEQPASDANSTSSTRLRIVFTANASTVVFAWAGHIATQATWGVGQGATGVNGSPYHTRLISIDGSGGNQDRSLKASAVVVPPTCSVDGPRRLCPETTQAVYTSTTDAADNGAVTFAWSLINNTANAVISGSTTGNSITVVPGIGGFTPGGIYNVQLIVTRSGAHHTCYLGTCCTGPGDNVTVDNVQVTATAAKGGSSTYSDPLNFSLAETSTANLKAAASLNGTADNSPFGFTWVALAPYTISGSNVQLAASPFTVVGTITGATTATSTFTATRAVSGLQFRVTATETATPNCQASDPVTINITGVASCPELTGPGTICANSQNLTYTASGLAAILPVANTTYTWSISPSNAATIVGDNINVGSITVNSGTTDFTVQLQISFTNSTLNPPPCTYPVTVNNITSGSIAGNQTLCDPFDPAAFTSTTAGTGTATVTYQWQSSTTSAIAGFTNIGGATSETYDAPAVSVKTWYQRVATSTVNGVPCSAISNVISVSPNHVSPGTIGSDQLLCFGADPAAFTSTTAGSGDGAVTYQWRSSTTSASVNLTDIGGATSATYDAGPVSVKTWFIRVAISTLNGVECRAVSDPVVVDLQQCIYPHLFPTQTTCCNYLGGDIGSFQLQRSCITVSGGKITNATPGVFFYYGSYTAATGGPTTITVSQSNDKNLSPFLPQGTGGGNANVVVDNCQSVPGTVTIDAGNGQNAGNVTFTFTAIQGKTYVVFVKYDMKSIVSKNAPAPSGSNSTPWATYSFSMIKGGTQLMGSSGQLPLFGSGTYSGVTYTCNSTEQTPSGTCPTPAVTVRDIQTPLVGQVKTLQAAAYPNPFNSNVSFQFASPESGKASLEVYDLLGRKLAIVFQGNVDAGKQTTVNYKVPLGQRVPMVYKLRVGSETVYGKLLPGSK